MKGPEPIVEVEHVAEPVAEASVWDDVIAILLGEPRDEDQPGERA